MTRHQTSHVMLGFQAANAGQAPMPNLPLFVTLLGGIHSRQLWPASSLPGALFTSCRPKRDGAGGFCGSKPLVDLVTFDNMLCFKVSVYRCDVAAS